MPTSLVFPRPGEIWAELRRKHSMPGTLLPLAGPWSCNCHGGQTGPCSLILGANDFMSSPNQAVMVLISQNLLSKSLLNGGKITGPRRARYPGCFSTPCLQPVRPQAVTSLCAPAFLTVAISGALPTLTCSLGPPAACGRWRSQSPAPA